MCVLYSCQNTHEVFITCDTQYFIGVGGVKVSMVAFQAIDPGSIPGRRMILFDL